MNGLGGGAKTEFAPGAGNPRYAIRHVCLSGLRQIPFKVKMLICLPQQIFQSTKWKTCFYLLDKLSSASSCSYPSTFSRLCNECLRAIDIHWCITKREKIQHCLLPNFLIYSLPTCSDRQDSLTSVQLNTNQEISAACCRLLTWCFDIFIYTWMHNCSQGCATIRQTRRLPRALGQRGRKKGPKNITTWFRKWRT